VHEEVEELAGVESARADHTTGTLVVRGDEVDDAAVRAAVSEAGYDVAR
jgi:copper chaperone CopZ